MSDVLLLKAGDCKDTAHESAVTVDRGKVQRIWLAGFAGEIVQLVLASRLAPSPAAWPQLQSQ